MPVYKVQALDGTTRNIEASEGTTQEQILAFIDSKYPAKQEAVDTLTTEQGSAVGTGIAGVRAQQAAPEESGIFRRWIGDNLLSLGQGVIGLGEAAVGLADIPTFGYAGKKVEAASDAIFGGDLEDASQYLQSLKTPEQLAQEQEVADAEGTGVEKFGNTIGALATNPGALLNTILNTLPQMAGGAVIARAGLNMAKNRAKKKLASNMKPATGKVTRKDALAPVSKDASLLPKQNYLKAAAYGEGIVAAGAAAESIRKQTEDGLLTPAQSGLALGSGVLTGVLGRIGGGATQKYLGVGDIDAALAGQAISEAGQRKVRNSILQAVKAGIGESVFEELPQSMQEQMVQNIALDRDPMEGVAEAAAEGVVAGFTLAGSITGGKQFLENRRIKTAEQDKEINKRIIDDQKEETKDSKVSDDKAPGVDAQQKQVKEEIEARRAAKRAEAERNKGGDVSGVVPGATTTTTTGANAAPAIFNISDFDSGRIIPDEEISKFGYVKTTKRKLQNLDYEKPQDTQKAIDILTSTLSGKNKNLNRPLIQEKINSLEKLQAARQEQKDLDAKAKKKEESKDEGGDVAGTTTVTAPKAAPVVDTTAAPDVIDPNAAPVVDTTAAPDVIDPNALDQQAADEFGFYPELQGDTGDQIDAGPVGVAPQAKPPAPDKKVFTQKTLDSLGYSKTGTIYKQLAGLTFGTGGLETAIEQLEKTLTRNSKTKTGKNIAAILPKLKSLKATKDVKKEIKEATDLFSQDELDDLRLMGATEEEFRLLKSTNPDDIAKAKTRLTQIVDGSTRNPTTKAAYRAQIKRLEAFTPTRFPIKPQAGLESEGVGAFATDAALEEGIGKGPVIRRNNQDIYISTKEYATALENKDTNYEVVSAKTLKPIDIAATDQKIENSLKGNSKNPITGTPVKVGNRITLARINPDAQKRKRKAYSAQLYNGVIVEDTFIDSETKEEVSELFLKVDDSPSNRLIALNDTQIVNPSAKDKKRIKEVAAGMQKKSKTARADRSKDYYAQQKAMAESVELTETPLENLDYLKNRKQRTLKEKVSEAKKALNKALTEKFVVKSNVDRDTYGEKKTVEKNRKKIKLVNDDIEESPKTVGILLQGLQDPKVYKTLNKSQQALVKMLAKVPNIKNVNVVIENIKETQARVKRATEAGEAAARRVEADAKRARKADAKRVAEAKAAGRPIRLIERIDQLNLIKNMKANAKNINRGDSDPDVKLGKTKRVLGSSAAINKEFEDIKKRARVAAYNKVFKQKVPIEKSILGDAAGQYNIATNTITVESILDLNTILHEMVHAATARGIRNLKPKSEVSKQLTQLFAEAKRAAKAMEIDDADINGYAQIDSLDEFVTMAFTDANYQRFLSDVKTETKIATERETELNGDTLWRSFVNAVKAIVGKFKEGISGSVLNNVIALESDLFIGPDDVQQRKYVGEILYNKKNNVEVKPPGDAEQVDKKISEKAGFIDKIVTNIFSFDAGLNRAIVRAMRATGQKPETIENAMRQMMAAQGLHAINLAQLYAEYGNINYNANLMKFEVNKNNPDSPDQSSMAKIKEQVNQYAVENDMSTEEYGKIAHRYFEAVRLDAVKKGINAEIIQDAEERGLEGAELDKRLEDLKYIHLTDAQINEALESVNQYSGLTEIADTWNEVRIKTINLLVDNGVMDANKAEEYIDSIGYVPFYRKDQNGETRELVDITSGLKQIGNLNNKRFRGSEKDVANIFENMDRWVQHSVRASIINRLKINKATISMQYADGILVRKMDEGEKVEEGVKGNIVTVTRNIDRTPTEDNPSPTKFVTERYEFSDPIFAAAFGSTFALAIGPIQQFFKSIASVLRQNVVLYPLFSLSQLPQDSVSAMISSGVKNPFMIPVRVLKEFSLTLMNMSKVREEVKRYGVVGDRSWNQASETDILFTPETYKERDTSTLIGSLAEKAEKNSVIGPLIKGLEKIAMASDNAVRQAVFEQTMRETATDKSSLQKIFETGDVGLAVDRAFEVINFRRKGSAPLINTLSQTVPFFSAGLQALSVQGRVLTGGGIAPGQRALQTRQTVKTAVMMTGVYLAYAAAMAGDEDYEKLDPKEKDTKLILPGGWSIPLRPDLFTYITKVFPENILRDLRGDQDGEKTFQAIRTGLANSMTISAIPQAVRPLIDVYMNESGAFSERRKIVPEYLKNEEGADQYKESTSEFAIATAKLTGVSAIKIDYFMRQYFGYTAGLITMSVDELIRQSGMLPYELPERSFRDILTDIPGTTPFVVREFGNRELSDYYEMKEQVSKIVSTFNKMQKPDNRMAYDTKRVQEFARENAETIQYGTLIKNKDKALKKLRKQRRFVLAQPKENMSGATKERLLKQNSRQQRQLLSDIKEYRKNLYE